MMHRDAARDSTPLPAVENAMTDLEQLWRRKTDDELHAAAARACRCCRA